MRRVSLAALSVAALGLTTALTATSPAHAQDYQPWSGFYVGGNIGFSWGDNSASTVFSRGPGPVVIPPIELNLVNGAVDTSNKTGFSGGIEGGYDYTSGNLLLGLETDFNWMNVEQRRTNSYSAGGGATLNVTGRTSTDWVWTLRPRVGYVSGPWLFYFTGGLATTQAKIEASYSDTRNAANGLITSDDKTMTGWTAGLGGGYSWNRNWSAKAEWLYADFGNFDQGASSPNGYITADTKAKIKANIIRVGVDYHF